MANTRLNGKTLSLLTALLLIVASYGAAEPAESAKEARNRRDRPLFGNMSRLFKHSVNRHPTVRITFAVRELWHYDHQEKKWVQIEGAAKNLRLSLGTPGTPGPGIGALDIDLAAVLPADAFGLYYAKWTFGGTEGGTLIYAADFGLRHAHDTDPPEGMIAIGVPMSKVSVYASHIPDPRIACNPAPATTRPAQPPPRQ